MLFIKKIGLANVIFWVSFVICCLLGGYMRWIFPKGEELLWVAKGRNNILDIIFPAITLLGEAYIYIIAVLYAIIKRNKKLVVSIALLGTLSALVSYVSKWIFSEARPFIYFTSILKREDLVSYVPNVELANSFTSSFPSGHTLAAFAFYSFVVFLVKNNLIKMVLLCLSILVGYSRMYLFQHFINDVVAGAIIGVLLSVLVYYYHTKVEAKQIVTQ
jgi:membrane-associated phospholipid phosphatase